VYKSRRQGKGMLLILDWKLLYYSSCGTYVSLGSSKRAKARARIGCECRIADAVITDRLDREHEYDLRRESRLGALKAGLWDSLSSGLLVSWECDKGV